MTLRGFVVSDFTNGKAATGPQYGNAANREAALRAFHAAWIAGPKARSIIR
jgi:hypothetical protein